MRGGDEQIGALFSYVSCEVRVSAVTENFRPLVLVACRHNGLPVPPQFLARLIPDDGRAGPGSEQEGRDVGKDTYSATTDHGKGAVATA